MGGADFGFLVAGAVAAALYPLVVTVFPEPAEVYGRTALPPMKGNRV
ncbi:hypothetical protein K1T35_03105 [Pseudonocardia sp. DSM 110487]|nr:hypothetical protein [Pseudonocardia sp. DSM 110487]QYN36334.1 hypothetical protein K1T35_03105 [Pseudonocardia sp. DSM 110487]